MIFSLQNRNVIGVAVLIVLLIGTADAQYSLVGKAVQTGTKTYQLTPDSLWKEGSVWNNNKIDLNNSFDLYFDLYFGIHDVTGADGMTFTLQPLSTNIGNAGLGLGVGGVTPSLIVEYDTYQNTPYDIVADHIAIEKNGNVDHNTLNTLAGPIQASASSINIEDGQFHTSRVKWNAATKTLDVYFDCVLRLSYTNDVVANIFAGNPNVYYGFTASTGGSKNEQIVRDFHFVPYKKMVDTICAGDSIQIDISGDLTYNWSPDSNITSTTSSKPFLFPTVPTQYLVDVTNCYASWQDTIVVAVNAKPLVDLGPDVSACFAEGKTLMDTLPNIYSSVQWSNGSNGLTIVYTKAEQVIVAVSNAFSCQSKDTIAVTAYCDSMSLCFPNVFTPNGDGINDDFRPCGNTEEEIKSGNISFYNTHLTFMHFVIYDRWGIKVFEEKKTEIPIWDGLVSNNLASSGTYYWVANYSDLTNKSFEKSGYLTLLR